MQYIGAAFLDVDGTLSEDPSCWRAAHRHYGVSDQAMGNYNRYLEHRDFPRWMREDISLWVGKKHPEKLHVREIQRIFSKPKLISGAQDLIDYLRKERYLVELVTLGFSAAIYPVSDALGVPRENVYANDFELDEHGNLTGEGVPKVFPHKKSDIARRVCAEAKLKLSESIALTDTHWDSDLLQSCGTGIAFCPKKGDSVRNAANHIVEESDLMKVVEYLESLKTKA